MIKFNKSAPSVDQLEIELATAKAKLDKSLAAHRAARIDFEIAKTDVAEAETPENMTAYTTARAVSQATSQDVANAKEHLAEATRVLDLARTTPLREATAKLPVAAAEALVEVLPALRLAVAQTVDALDNASFAEIAGASQAGTLFAGWIHNANRALLGGDAEKFVEELRAYARGILDGSKPATLQPTLADQRSDVLRRTA